MFPSTGSPTNPTNKPLEHFLGWCWPLTANAPSEASQDSAWARDASDPHLAYSHPFLESEKT